MSLPGYISKRYIFSFRELSFISIINFLSIIGITVGAAAIICVMSLFNGFRSFNTSVIIGFDSHLRIYPADSDRESIMKTVVTTKGIRSAAPMTEMKVVVRHKGMMKPLTLLSTQPGYGSYYRDIDRSVIISTLRKKGEKSHGLRLGMLSAEELDISAGEEIELFSAPMIERAIRSVSYSPGVTAGVAGIYRSNIRQKDKGYIYDDTGIAEKLTDSGKDFSFIDIKLADEEDVDAVKADLYAKLGKNVLIEDWRDMHADIYGVMKLEKYGSFILLSLVIVIAVFNILASLSMTVIKKKKDIGILKALGADRSTIRNIFIREGIYTGVFSSLAGCFIGAMLSYIQQAYGIIKFGNPNLLVTAIPFELQWGDVLLTGAVAMALSFGATLFPSKRAAALSVVEALRH